MKKEPPEIEADLSKHQLSFDQQPIATKELELLNDQVEKSIGKETTRLHEIIKDKSEEVPMNGCQLL